jgi:hypothetical protein
MPPNLLDIHILLRFVQSITISGFYASFNLSPKALGASPIFVKSTFTCNFYKISLFFGRRMVWSNGFPVGLITGIIPFFYAFSYAGIGVALFGSTFIFLDSILFLFNLKVLP